LAALSANGQITAWFEVSRCATSFADYGQVYCRKDARILASGVFSQHAKLNMASFVLYLLDHFGLRCRMVELCSKAPTINLPAGNAEGDSAMEAAFSNQHSAVSEKQNQQQHQRRFTTEGTEKQRKAK
jgi:hypothetical protein